MENYLKAGELSHLKDVLYGLLVQAKAPLSEYDIIKALLDQDVLHKNSQVFLDTYELFKVHFVLFHSLYSLRMKLLAEKKACLQVSPLGCELQDYCRGDVAIVEYDELLGFYLDMENYFAFNPDELRGMVGDFFLGLKRREDRDQALAILGLQDPISSVQIKAHYRRLVMQVHPDKGGDGERFKAINAAFRMLDI